MQDSQTAPTDKQRKRYGAYYTPTDLATQLVQWALDGEPGSVLDPSFGGCSFLNAALDALGHLNCDDPGKLIFGVDVDRSVGAHSRALRNRGVPAGNVLIRDFLALRPGELNQGLGFRAVVGNPPYLRHHVYQGSRRRVAQQAMDTASVRLPSTASSWAHFVVHGTRFVRTGGRLAYLLPNSALHAEYAHPVLEYLEREFREVRLVQLRERIFEGVDAGTVALLASGRGQGRGALYFEELTTAKNLGPYLQGALRRKINGVGRDGDLNRLAIPSAASALFGETIRLPQVRGLATLSDVRIGVVTGCNRFFIRRPSEMGELRARGVRFVSIISRGAWLNTPSWSKGDQRNLDRRDVPCKLLLISKGADRTSRLRSLIEEARQQKVHLRSQCSQRTAWQTLQDWKKPTAFLKYMNASTPTVIPNAYRVTCSNSVHRLYWIDSGVDLAPV